MASNERPTLADISKNPLIDTKQADIVEDLICAQAGLLGWSAFFPGISDECHRVIGEIEELKGTIARIHGIEQSQLG